MAYRTTRGRTHRVSRRKPIGGAKGRRRGSGVRSSMSSHLFALCFDARDPLRLARFWAELLDWDLLEDAEGAVALQAKDDVVVFRLRFVPSDAEKVEQNQMHLDLTSTSSADQQQTVARALELGAQHLDVGQLPEEGHVVLADPEGNELCVIEPGNDFLAGCGFLGAVACDGSQQVGYFWSEALGWPLVWDEDAETAIRSPHGGPKITWGGPPLKPKTGKYRLHFDLLPATGTTGPAEVDRLVTLGATRVDTGRGDVAWTVMLDPDGHEFCVLGSSEVPEVAPRTP